MSRKFVVINSSTTCFCTKYLPVQILHMDEYVNEMTWFAFWAIVKLYVCRQYVDTCQKTHFGLIWSCNFIYEIS